MNVTIQKLTTYSVINIYVFICNLLMFGVKGLKMSYKEQIFLFWREFKYSFDKTSFIDYLLWFV